MGELLYNMKILNYSSKERLIGILVIPPVAIVINYFVFGASLFCIAWAIFYYPPWLPPPSF